MGSRVALVLRDPVTLIVGALATHRLTRLITDDKVTAPLRDRISDAAPEGRLAYFVRCRWCVSPYIAAGWAALDRDRADRSPPRSARSSRGRP
jgi:hypothetical protein